MRRLLYSYVVDHDYGDAPNPYFGMCTLVKCKYSKDGKRNNLIESVYQNCHEITGKKRKYDEIWVVGTGGVDLTKSSGNGTILYLMKVDEAIKIEDYKKLPNYQCKKPDFRSEGIKRFGDNDSGKYGKYALISHKYYYFGNNAIPIPQILKESFPHISLEKNNQGFKFKMFNDEYIECLIDHIKQKFKYGLNGIPCGVKSQMEMITNCKSSCANGQTKNENRPTPRRC